MAPRLIIPLLGMQLWRAHARLTRYAVRVDFRFWRRKAQSPPVKAACCNGLTWTPVADFGNVAGFDVDLGKCGVCGSYLLCLGYGASATYHRVRDERAAYYLSLQKNEPERLRLVLRKWADG